MTHPKLDTAGRALEVGSIAYLVSPGAPRDRVARVEVTDLCPQYKTIVEVRILQLLTDPAREYFRVGQVFEPACVELTILETRA